MSFEQAPHLLELKVLQDEVAHFLSQPGTSLPAELLLRQRRLRLRGRLPQQDARNLRERRLARELSLLALLKYARKVRLDLLLCQRRVHDAMRVVGRNSCLGRARSAPASACEQGGFVLAALNLCNEATALPLPPAQPPIELPDQNRGDTRPTLAQQTCSC